MCTLSVIKDIKPDIIMNAGTCGGIIPEYAFDTKIESWPNVGIGDVFIGKNSIYSDRRIGLPVFKEWGIGNYELFAVIRKD